MRRDLLERPGKSRSCAAEVRRARVVQVFRYRVLSAVSAVAADVGWGVEQVDRARVLLLRTTAGLIGLFCAEDETGRGCRLPKRADYCSDIAKVIWQRSAAYSCLNPRRLTALFEVREILKIMLSDRQ